MGVDALTALVNLANAIHTSGLRFLFVFAVVLGIYGAQYTLVKEAKMARLMPGHNGMGKVIIIIIICGMLIGLAQIINAGARQLGWSDVTFDEVSYVSTSSFGAGADAVNALLTLLQTVGVAFVLSGVQRVKRSLKDGHTGLSAGEDVASGTVKFIAGIFLICAPTLLDAIQASLGLNL
ncbi:conjugal transfer protein TraQ [Serratia ficaria]|uniref:conjugal transfer protein TraQ n=1 Tax=Serratia ficaria TaxID=61651 RepID=UPI00077C4E24|nr:conjugal transfer protein TraQ [Serratia ficaria]